MNRRYLLPLIISGAVVVLAFANISIYNYEKLLREGEKIYLKLAPADPRSMMQGDYMSLRFDIQRQILPQMRKCPQRRYLYCNGEGRVRVSVESNGTAGFVSIYRGEMLSKNEMILRFRVSRNRVRFASGRYFFKEGDGDIYSRAAYEGFRVGPNGAVLPDGLYDANLSRLGRR